MRVCRHARGVHAESRNPSAHSRRWCDSDEARISPCAELGLLRCARNDGLDPLSSRSDLNSPPFPCIPPQAYRNKEQENDRSRGPGVSGDPRAHHHARRSAAGDASSGAGHLFRRDDRHDRQPAARSLEIVCHQGPLLHLYRQRPRRVGSHADQRAVARRQDPGAGKRPVRDRLGPGRRRHGRRGRGAEGRLAPRHPPGRSRGTAAAGQGPHHQGDPRGAGRYRLGRL